MDTTNDVDLELIFSLGLPFEQKCESIYHDNNPSPNSAWYHSDGGTPWYVLMKGSCSCNPRGITVRCESWKIANCDIANGTIWNCPVCGGLWSVSALEPVE